MLALRGYLLCWHDVANLDAAREQFEPNAFINPSARLVFGHDPRPGAILGFARVVQDRHGARFSAQRDERRRDVRQAIGAIRYGANFCSFKFRPHATPKVGDLVTVERAMLLDVSIVSDPAYWAGGVWLVGDKSYLPPRLAALAEQFDRGLHNDLCAERARFPVIRAVDAKPPRRAAAIAAGHNPPQAPSVAGITVRRPAVDPLRLGVMRHMGGYLARCPHP